MFSILVKEKHVAGLRKYLNRHVGKAPVGSHNLDKVNGSMSFEPACNRASGRTLVWKTLSDR